MSRDRVALAHGLTSLAALGVAVPAELLEGDLGPRSERSGAEPERVRFPLPGTPEANGVLTGAPRGAGTGWVVLRRWRAPRLAKLLAARFTRPRSASLAEREWNLLCHLRARGVGAPEPLAVGARGDGLIARSSFLVTRELEGFQPLPTWLAAKRPAQERRRGLIALSRFLNQLAGSGVCLPDLRAASILVRPGTSVVAAEAESCSAAPTVGGMTLERWPTIALAGAEGGRMYPSLAGDALIVMFRGLAVELARCLTRGEALRLFSRAARSLARVEKRRLWQRIAAGE